ncbi:hypothetical protein LA324_05250 [Corynebacterium coyleae]|nr:hypothetical protein LA324_05250 [Corynebacterium coyleae]
MIIKAVLEHYFPGWEAPEDEHDGWIKCECPVHDDDNPSASVSYELDSFKCHGCGYSGDYIKIIESEEGCGYVEAIATAARISEQCGVALPPETSRKSSRGVSRPARFRPL